uniref:Uncharacterized protein n=1 Tax=Ciona intestinalis TaxID=7719 RepID=H2XT56_CIOIN
MYVNVFGIISVKIVYVQYCVNVLQF